MHHSFIKRVAAAAAAAAALAIHMKHFISTIFCQWQVVNERRHGNLLYKVIFAGCIYQPTCVCMLK